MKKLKLPSIDFIFSRTNIFSWSDFILPSNLQVASYVKILLEPISSNKSIDRIELGLHEALINAVIHGNNGDYSKLIRIRRITTPKWFVLQIQDEGMGINKNKRIASLPTEVESEGGRGLFIIHECFDDVRWSRKGNRLQIALKRQ